MKDTPNILVPIIIGGAHRSGTSLIRRIINGSPEIYCPPEIKFYKDLLGQYLNDDLAFARLGESIKALKLPEEIWLDEFGKAYIRCMELAATREGKNRWADKNPENSLNISHWHRLLKGNLKFVLVIRNPLDVFCSMEEIKFKRAIPSDLLGRINFVKSYLDAGMYYCKLHPENSYIIRYEDVVNSTHITFDRLFEWLGAQWDKQSLTRINSLDHGVGFEDPKIKNNATIVGLSIDRWKRDLTEEDRTLIIREFKEFMDRFGY